MNKKLTSLYSLPALLIGIYTMIHFQISKSIWMMNLGIYLICLLGVLFLPKLKGINPKILIGISILLLLSTFISEGVEGVHRWVKISKISLNIGLIVSPILLIQISKLSSPNLKIFVILAVSLLFLFQPDASQVTAFSIAVSLLLDGKDYNKVVRLALLFIITISWNHLDALQPVNYVEGIVSMAKGVSVLLMIFGIISLILIPLPFFQAYHSNKNYVVFALGVYFLITIISSFVGNFPVIIMGYGISPIIGYFVGINAILKN